MGRGLIFTQHPYSVQLKKHNYIYIFFLKSVLGNERSSHHREQICVISEHIVEYVHVPTQHTWMFFHYRYQQP